MPNREIFRQQIQYLGSFAPQAVLLFPRLESFNVGAHLNQAVFLFWIRYHVAGSISSSVLFHTLY